jgi:hypothetical protein
MLVPDLRFFFLGVFLYLLVRVRISSHSVLVLSVLNLVFYSAIAPLRAVLWPPVEFPVKLGPDLAPSSRFRLASVIPVLPVKNRVLYSAQFVIRPLVCSGSRVARFSC